MRTTLPTPPQQHSRPPRRTTGALGAAAALALAACGGHPAAAAPSGAGSAAPPPVTVSDPASGSTVALRVGQTLHVVLGAPDTTGSTYWQFAAVASPLRQSGPVSTVPGPRSGRCARAGSGCGTVTLTVVATSAGRATLTAGRDSCGEAVRCDAAHASLSLVVDIS